MYDVQLIDEDDAPVCSCCRCRVPIPNYPRAFGVTLLCALLFVPAWIYMALAHLPAAIAAVVGLL